MVVSDDSGDIALVFFNASARRMEALLPLGEKRWVSGRIEMWDGRRQMVHPDRVLDAAAVETMPPFEPVYGLTAGLGPRSVAKAAGAAVERIPTLPEWQDAAWLRVAQVAVLRRRAARAASPVLGGRAGCPTRRPGSASPMTSSWPANSRCCWRAST